MTSCVPDQTNPETDWSYRRGQGVPPLDATIEVTLAADGGHTRLVIEVSGMPLDKIAFHGAGWQIHAEDLADHLAGRDRQDAAARRDALVPPYLELAPAIGDTIGPNPATN